MLLLYIHVQNYKVTNDSKITLQKWKDCFNLGRVISIAASLPINVNTRRLITLLVHYRSPLQFQTCRQVNN